MTERYSRLYEAWEKERRSTSLQPLPESFFSEMSEYASLLREQTRMHEKDSLISRIAEKEKENAERMISDLYQIRLRKIVGSELEGEALKPLALALEERRLLAELRRILSQHSEGLKSILMGRALRLEAKSQRVPSGFKVVRFMEALPAIIGVDMKTYGPFKSEDVASIPAENAENLIRRGIAKEVVVSE